MIDILVRKNKAYPTFFPKIISNRLPPPENIPRYVHQQHIVDSKFTNNILIIKDGTKHRLGRISNGERIAPPPWGVLPKYRIHHKLFKKIILLFYGAFNIMLKLIVRGAVIGFFDSGW
ncbi:MAG: hypothetical protein Q6363_000330, partial [Candidatus Njordarchaeota archaeon]